MEDNLDGFTDIRNSSNKVYLVKYDMRVANWNIQSRFSTRLVANVCSGSSSSSVQPHQNRIWPCICPCPLRLFCVTDMHIVCCRSSASNKKQFDAAITNYQQLIRFLTETTDRALRHKAPSVLSLLNQRRDLPLNIIPSWVWGVVAKKCTEQSDQQPEAVSQGKFGLWSMK